MTYHVHVSQFEGPLDLLLHLIERAELDIKDIFVSEITTQYLLYMQQLDDLDMDTASEFLAMAATLLYIKSRQLLPRPPKEQPEEEDPEVLLIRQLHEYKAFKQAGEDLCCLQEGMQNVFTRLPEEYALPQQELLLSTATLEELYRAFEEVLKAQPKEQLAHPLHHVLQDTYTVRKQVAKIRDLLMRKKEVRFEELFEHGVRMELVVTLMALLDMLTRNEVHLHQSAPFRPIRVRAVTLQQGDEGMDYMDEVEIL
ncbi:segregation/condensation protein A [Christensenellaceae bacterium OttesenSCG-928-L17]|nr:segregation/condensation protein A [Christensenellaceae bacterium OttesenSCG-928-L17]